MGTHCQNDPACIGRLAREGQLLHSPKAPKVIRLCHRDIVRLFDNQNVGCDDRWYPAIARHTDIGDRPLGGCVPMPEEKRDQCRREKK